MLKTSAIFHGQNIGLVNSFVYYARQNNGTYHALLYSVDFKAPGDIVNNCLPIDTGTDAAVWWTVARYTVLNTYISVRNWD